MLDYYAIFSFLIADKAKVSIIRIAIISIYKRKLVFYMGLSIDLIFQLIVSWSETVPTQNNNKKIKYFMAQNNLHH